MLYTLGHSNLTPEAFLALLAENGVKCVIDVRSKPYSQYVKWANRDPFRAMLVEVGIRYVFGGTVLGGKAPYKLTDEAFQDKLHRVVEVHGETPALMMCSEKDPRQCHRAFKLSHALHSLYPDLQIGHIIGPGTVLDSREFEAAQSPDWPFK